MKKVVPIDTNYPNPVILSKAAKVLLNGGIIAFPTDTFYGLAVNPYDNAAVKRLFKVKRRSTSKPIILLIDNPSKLAHLIENPGDPFLNMIIDAFWPGPLTLVLKDGGYVDKAVRGETQTVGVRMPAAAVPIGIIQNAGIPITATSANRSGSPAATKASDIEKSLGLELDLILDGGTCENTPSTLLDLSSGRPQILRKGKIPSEKICSFIQTNMPGVSKN